MSYRCRAYILSTSSILCRAAHWVTQSCYGSSSCHALDRLPASMSYPLGIIHASNVFTYSFLPVLSRSASFTFPLRTPVHGLYSLSFSIHPRHVAYPSNVVFL